MFQFWKYLFSSKKSDIATQNESNSVQDNAAVKNPVQEEEVKEESPVQETVIEEPVQEAVIEEPVQETVKEEPVQETVEKDNKLLDTIKEVECESTDTEKKGERGMSCDSDAMTIPTTNNTASEPNANPNQNIFWP